MRTKIEQAMELARQYHQGQTRTGTGGKQVPYYEEHVEKVYRILHEGAGVEDASILIMALLHDTLEDTSLTEKQIEEQFGRDVAQQVRYLTRRSKEPFNEYTERLFAYGDDRAVLVKLADRYHNLSTILNVTDVKWIAKKVKQTEVDILEPLRKRTLQPCYIQVAQYLVECIQKELKKIRNVYPYM